MFGLEILPEDKEGGSGEGG